MPEPTLLLLRRLHAGEPDALNALVERHLPAIRAQVERRLGAKLRRRAEPEDFVQEVLVEFLRVGPRFHISDDAHFRRLLARIVENVLRDQHDWFTALRRTAARARPLPPDTVLELDPPRRKSETPSQAANRNEEEAWVRLALELVDPARRELVVRRQWEGCSFAEMGKRLGVTEEAARQRYLRAVSDLSRVVGALRRGELDAALTASDAPAKP